MQYSFAWARRPMLQRISTDLTPHLPVSIIYGSRSWVYHLKHSVMEQFQQTRPNSYVASYLIADATHHVHADKPRAFNTTVKNILAIVDSNRDL